MENIKNSNIDSNKEDIHIEEKDSREFDFGPNHKRQSKQIRKRIVWIV